METSRICTARIHPAIGIARVGNSLEEYFIGPEVPHPTGPPAAFNLTGKPAASGPGYRDPQGHLRRQAARFRVYGYDHEGKMVGEITSADADIAWTVHVANKKSGWYQYDAALDLRPESSTLESARRNSTIRGNQRMKLIVDPGKQSILGNSQSAQCFEGSFFSTPVYLGEIRTDEVGRLLFLGGRGAAGSPFPGYNLVTFGNNPGWYDDISDGPVEATVTIGGRPIPVDAAWVVTAPPSYAPDIVSPVTMFDLIFDTLVGTNFPALPQPRFTEEILPIFQRLANLQWVNTAFFVQFGWQGPNDFLRPDFLRRLAAPGLEFKELRRQTLYMFRNPAGPTFEAWQWPQMYGDGLGSSSSAGESPRNGLSLTSTQYGYLTDWMNGNFEANYNPEATPPQSIDDYGVAEQPEALDRAALTFCLGGPFHPGSEMTWPMRRACMYRAGMFRLRRHPEDWDYPDYGDFLNQTTVLAPSGPLAASGPGDITRWMSVPWHADAASCMQGYPGFETATLFNVDPYLPTFWPARVPNEVLAEQDYQIVIDQSNSLPDRIAAFNRRRDWVRILGSQSAPYLDTITKMVGTFYKMGVVERRDAVNDGMTNDPDFPAVMYVETLVPPAPIPTEAATPAPPVAVAETASLLREPPATMSAGFMRERFGGRRRR